MIGTSAKSLGHAYYAHPWPQAKKQMYVLPKNLADAPIIRPLQMFSMNLPSWKHHPFILQRCGSVIDQLERELQAFATHVTSEGEIMWGMRQLAYKRT